MINQTTSGWLPLVDKIPSLSIVKISAWSVETADAHVGVSWWEILVDN
tara:strand:+ start:1453 stop:1596 length:144 start_codon:yes stop_codon:yes gene_type:complete